MDNKRKFLIFCIISLFLGSLVGVGMWFVKKIFGIDNDFLEGAIVVIFLFAGIQIVNHVMKKTEIIQLAEKDRQDFSDKP